MNENKNIIKLSPKNLSNKMREHLEQKNYDDETIQGLKKRGFLCRLPYPLTLSTLIDIAERMGIMNEQEVMPRLYKVREELSLKIKELPKN